MAYNFDEEWWGARNDEPRTLPDFYIEPTATCGVCGIQNSVERRMTLVCNTCGNPTHQECGTDTEPSGGWDRDWDENYWVCNTCLNKPAMTEFELDSKPMLIYLDEPLGLAADTGKKEK